MTKSKTILYVLLLWSTVSCSQKLAHGNINQPFYDQFEKDVRISHKDFGNTVPFKAYYEEGKYEIDRRANFRNKVIDSLQLAGKPKWLLVTLNGTNYSGTYEKTFLIFDDKVVSYDLPRPDAAQQPDVDQMTLDALKDQYNDVYAIYAALENGEVAVRHTPNTNPLLHYKMVVVKGKKTDTYMASSKDYQIKKWK